MLVAPADEAVACFGLLGLLDRHVVALFHRVVVGVDEAAGLVLLRRVRPRDVPLDGFRSRARHRRPAWHLGAVVRVRQRARQRWKKGDKIYTQKNV